MPRGPKGEKRPAEVNSRAFNGRTRMYGGPWLISNGELSAMRIISQIPLGNDLNHDQPKQADNHPQK
jgi:hypothetical protein